jgi:hypothetical protein
MTASMCNQSYTRERQPYAGDDKQAYLYKWRKVEKRRIADARGAKDAERVELEAIAAAKERRDNAGKVPKSASRGSRAGG